MQLRNILLILIFLTVNGVCCAQQKKVNQGTFEIINGKDIYHAIYDSVSHHIDSLDNWKEKGVLFFKMELSNSRFTNIKCSEYDSSLLAELVSKVLKSQQVKTQENKGFDNYVFVLPVFFNYATNSIGSPGELLKKVPKVDIDNLTPKQTNGFDQFFQIDNSSSFYGVKCIFLPWINLRGKVQ